MNRQLGRAVRVLVITAALSLLPIANAWAGLTYTADVLVSAHGHALKGDGVYNTTGQGQTALKRVPARGDETFDLGFDNDGNVGGSYHYQGCASSRKFKVSYYSSVSGDLSLAFAAGFDEYLPAGFQIRTADVTLTATAKAKSGDRKTCKTSMTSLEDGSFTDVAIAILQVR